MDVHSEGGRGGWLRCERMRTSREGGSECMRTSATLLVTYRAGIAAALQQCMAILITPPVTALAVLNRPLWLWSL